MYVCYYGIRNHVYIMLHEIIYSMYGLRTVYVYYGVL